MDLGMIVAGLIALLFLGGIIYFTRSARRNAEAQSLNEARSELRAEAEMERTSRQQAG